MFTPQGGDHEVADGAVVDGVVQAVAGPCRAQVTGQVQVDLQRLVLALFVVQHATAGHHLQAPQLDAVGPGGTRGHIWPRERLARSSAALAMS